LDTDTILAAKRRALAHRQEKTPVSAVVALASLQKAPMPVLNMVTNGEHVTVIGQVRHAEIYDPVMSALRYVRSGVDAISMLSDLRVYSKGMDDLTLVARAINSPILIQDYILNEYHVAEARAAGASALVLHTGLLDPKALRQVVSATMRWRMTAIVQIESADQLSEVARLSPHVIAVGTNAPFDPDTDLDLLIRVRERLPFNMRVMPLGCIQTVQALSAVVDIGVDGVIIDEQLFRRPDQFDELRGLIHTDDTGEFKDLVDVEIDPTEE
jgi:indole-3-glycerol phosphate synthase